MNKLSAMLTTCFLGFTLTACTASSAAPAGSADPAGSGSAADTPTPSGSSVPYLGSGSVSVTNDPNTRVYRDCVVTVLGYSLCKDCDGDPALRVEYQFQNNSQSSESFSTTVIPSAYQGEDPEETLAYTTPAETDPEYSALLVLLKPGESITCAGYFKLISTELPVELEVKDLRDSSVDALCRTLDITGMTIENTVSETSDTE